MHRFPVNSGKSGNSGAKSPRATTQLPAVSRAVRLASHGIGLPPLLPNRPWQPNPPRQGSTSPRPEDYRISEEDIRSVLEPSPKFPNCPSRSGTRPEINTRVLNRPRDPGARLDAARRFTPQGQPSRVATAAALGMAVRPMVGMDAGSVRDEFERWLDEDDMLESTRAESGEKPVSDKALLSSVGYNILDTILGEGAFAKVRLAKVNGNRKAAHRRSVWRCLQDNGDENMVAVKQVEDDGLTRDMDIFLAGLDHPHILKTYEAFKSDGRLHFIQEACLGGTLSDYVYKAKFRNGIGLHEHMARTFFVQLVSGLYYLHTRGICHRDLKPDNILLDNREKDLKIADFGLSTINMGIARASGNSDSRTFRPAPDYLMCKGNSGTFSFTAPEVIFVKDGEFYNGITADCYSLGTVLFFMVNGRKAFNLAGRANIIRDQKKLVENRCNLPFLPWTASASEECIDLGTQLMAYYPLDRISLMDSLDHAWVRKQNLPPGHILLMGSRNRQPPVSRPNSPFYGGIGSPFDAMDMRRSLPPLMVIPLKRAAQHCHQPMESFASVQQRGPRGGPSQYPAPRNMSLKSGTEVFHSDNESTLADDALVITPKKRFIKDTVKKILETRRKTPSPEPKPIDMEPARDTLSRMSPLSPSESDVTYLNVKTPLTPYDSPTSEDCDIDQKSSAARVISKEVFIPPLELPSSSSPQSDEMQKEAPEPISPMLAKANDKFLLVNGEPIPMGGNLDAAKEVAKPEIELVLPVNSLQSDVMKNASPELASSLLPEGNDKSLLLNEKSSAVTDAVKVGGKPEIELLLPVALPQSSPLPSAGPEMASSMLAEGSDKSLVMNGKSSKPFEDLTKVGGKPELELPLPVVLPQSSALPSAAPQLVPPMLAEGSDKALLLNGKSPPVADAVKEGGKSELELPLSVVLPQSNAMQIGASGTVPPILINSRENLLSPADLSPTTVRNNVAEIPISSPSDGSISDAKLPIPSQSSPINSRPASLSSGRADYESDWESESSNARQSIMSSSQSDATRCSVSSKWKSSSPSSSVMKTESETSCSPASLTSSPRSGESQDLTVRKSRLPKPVRKPGAGRKRSRAPAPRSKLPRPCSSMSTSSSEAEVPEDRCLRAKPARKEEVTVGRFSRPSPVCSSTSLTSIPEMIPAPPKSNNRMRRPFPSATVSKNRALKEASAPVPTGSSIVLMANNPAAMPSNRSQQNRTTAGSDTVKTKSCPTSDTSAYKFVPTPPDSANMVHRSRLPRRSPPSSPEASAPIRVPVPPTAPRSSLSVSNKVSPSGPMKARIAGCQPVSAAHLSRPVIRPNMLRPTEDASSFSRQNPNRLSVRPPADFQRAPVVSTGPSYSNPIIPARSAGQEGVRVVRRNALLVAEGRSPPSDGNRDVNEGQSQGASSASRMPTMMKSLVTGRVASLQNRSRADRPMTAKYRKPMMPPRKN